MINKQHFDDFCNFTLEETIKIIKYLDYDLLKSAAEMIINAKNTGNRLHVSGIGKPAYIAGYIASLMSSTGTPTYVLHGTEAVHGSCGQLVQNDIVIFISNSGNTSEMKATVQAVKNNGCKVIGVTGNPDSWLAKESNIYLLAHIDNEGGPLNRAPRTSILAEMITLQALSVLLQSDANVKPEQYVKWHPGGSLGQLRDNEK